MCFAAAIPMVIGAGVSAYQSYESARAQNRQADYNTQVALNNADISRQEASYARAQAMRNYAEEIKDTNRLIGAQRARQGSSGVTVGSGSSLDLVRDTAANGALRGQAELQKGDIAAWRAEVQAANYKAQADAYQSSKVSVGSVVTGSLLTSGAKMGASYLLMGGLGSIGGTDSFAGVGEPGSLMEAEFAANDNFYGIAG